MTLLELYGELCVGLEASHEAAEILAEATGERRAALLGGLHSEAPAEAVGRARALAARRREGEPLQHVVGHWGFRRIDVLQDRRALVVRPETEIVVGVALGELARVDRPQPRVLDLGTGSGAIALSLVDEHPAVSVLATDASLAALALAKANRTRLGRAGERVVLLAAPWLTSLAGRAAFDLVVTNPPYVAEAEWAALDPVVRDFDPKEALVAGPSGLEALELIVREAPRVLAAGGALVAEIAPNQAAAVRQFAHTAGAREVRVETDLAGRDRVLVARY